jgi:hypothetical protein
MQFNRHFQAQSEPVTQSYDQSYLHLCGLLESLARGSGVPHFRRRETSEVGVYGAEGHAVVNGLDAPECGTGYADVAT